MKEKLDGIILKEDVEQIFLNDLRESLSILKETFQIEQKYFDIAYQNCNEVVEYSLKYFNIHRTEYKKVASMMLYVHAEYFKWCCNDFAEDIAFSKLQNKNAEEIYDEDTPCTYKFEIYTLDQPSIQHIHNELFKKFKPDKWVEDLEKKLKQEVANETN